MASFKTPGSCCPERAPVHIQDGTRARAGAPRPGPVKETDGWLLQEYARRVGYVHQAWAKAQVWYTDAAVIGQVGEDAYDIIAGMLWGLVMAAGVLVVTTGVGAAVGGAAGFLVGGVGAAPGAVEGAEVGLLLGEGLLAWLGLGFLAGYLLEHFGEMGAKFQRAILRAWQSQGDPGTIDAAAREFAEAVGFFVSLLLQALVLFLLRSAGKGGSRVARALGQLRDSLLFKRCRGLEPWLVENFPKLRARFVKLEWKVLKEGPVMGGSSIPESMTIRVGNRVFDVIRNKEKPDAAAKPIGPALKHLGEKALGASEWAKMAQTDFPVSSLAAALDQAEAQLIFQLPQARAKPVKLDHWELLIDTTKEVWTVFHAEYTAHPRW
jgi:hypothetical protein